MIVFLLMRALLAAPTISQEKQVRAKRFSTGEFLLILISVLNIFLLLYTSIPGPKTEAAAEVAVLPALPRPPDQAAHHTVDTIAKLLIAGKIQTGKQLKSL